jgi:hypothetical protein
VVLGIVLHVLGVLTLVILTTTLFSKYIYSHFTDNENWGSARLASKVPHCRVTVG